MRKISWTGIAVGFVVAAFAWACGSSAPKLKPTPVSPAYSALSTKASTPWLMGDQKAAVAWLDTHPFTLLHGDHVEVVVLGTGLDGPPEETRWRAAVVSPDGKLTVEESCTGNSGDLNLLVQPGDALDVWLDNDNDCLDPNPNHLRVLVKQAVQIHSSLGSSK
jgi:hypothetical protein